jgi:hypothetical protein
MAAFAKNFPTVQMVQTVDMGDRQRDKSEPEPV